jgi:hypothetical protein
VGLFTSNGGQRDDASCTLVATLKHVMFPPRKVFYVSATEGFYAVPGFIFFLVSILQSATEPHLENSNVVLDQYGKKLLLIKSI